MSTKKISAGDTLTVGELTDDHLGAVIEVGEPEGILYRLTLNRSTPVKVIAPPPVVQPDEPTILGQCIRIKGDDDWLGVVVDPPGADCKIRDTEGYRWSWVSVLDRAGDRQIIVSDPPCWPDETPDVPERIAVGEWPDDDTHLRAWEWIDNDSCTWRWDNESGRWAWSAQRRIRPIDGPWTRGERVE